MTTDNHPIPPSATDATPTDTQAAYFSQFHESIGYVNFASVGAPSQAVLQTEQRMLEQLAAAGPHTVADLMEAPRAAARRVAAMTGRRPDEITMQPNTSTALYHAAFSLPADDHVPVVLLNAHEFPANLYPWKRAESAGLVSVRTYDGPANAASIAPLLDGVDVVSLSVVDFRTGYLADLDEIRETIGDRLMVVDGIQGFGVVDADWSQADVLAVGGQKWVRAGWSTGFMACSPRALERLSRPLLSGWSGAEGSERYDAALHEPLPGADRFAASVLSPIAAGRLDAALALVESVGVPWIRSRVARFAERLDEDVRTMGGALVRDDDPRHWSAILPLAFPGHDVAAIGRRLREAGVTCSVHPSTIRIAPHATTGEDTYRLLVDALRDAVAR
ncbi:aminotransferase class V [Bifidobacterium ramosum]|uniref:Aminotransferase class V n=1 Tax=Bifidobacterium ramosum TaxID=1798158 RepID=A0A6L4WXJ0_9BIFI|nr:aminotransferase class V-fold PLP-dependent enzyme [Bifidobacterium ramosum]KAB8286607.1 aminotransferase class V [Bifidobacterium ramosum]NEG72631.1 aminotransferase class V-fold PLP-dependent enzyme [Bifidobacterium ramosum]